MAKRFIDTGLFDDEWFSELGQQSKLFWIYYITKCDHAGFMKYNEKLIKFQTGISNVETVLKDFTNRIVRVGEQLLFSPKFIHYQYPNFPDCNFNSAKSAKEIMIKNNIDPNSYLTVGELLPNSYGNGNGNGISNSNGNTVKEPKKIELEIPFTSDEFLSVWRILIKEPKWRTKSQQSLQASLNKLSKHPEAVAIQMMENTIAGGWQGLFDLKQPLTNTVKPTPTKQELDEYERIKNIPLSQLDI